MPQAGYNPNQVDGEEYHTVSWSPPRSPRLPRPLGARILVLPDPMETKTKGGIIIPDTSQRRMNRGRVLAVGPGKYNDAGTLVPNVNREGTIVHYGRHAGHEIEHEGQTLLLMFDADVFCVEEESTDTATSLSQ